MNKGGWGSDGSCSGHGGWGRVHSDRGHPGYRLLLQAPNSLDQPLASPQGMEWDEAGSLCGHWPLS